MMQGPWEKYGGTPAAAAPAGAPAPVVVGIPRAPDPFKVRDQQLQEEAAARAREDQQFQREKFEREMAKPGAADPKLVEAERTAAFLATRLVGSVNDIARATETNAEAAQPSVIGTVAGIFGGEARNAVNSPERRRVEAAQMDVLDAALTLGTGAAYTREQLEAYRESHFPRLTDDPATVAEKNQRLRRLIEAAKVKAGKAAPQIEEALRLLGGSAEPEAKPTFEIGSVNGMDAAQQRTMEPGGPGIAISRGETETIRDPALAGLNARVNKMLKEGVSLSKIGQVISAAGVPRAEVQKSLLAAGKFRRENPGYKGDWDVRLDETQAPLTGLDQARAIVSSGPIGAAGIAAGNVVTGNHLDNLVEAGGGNGEIANIGMQLLRSEHPYASLAGDVAGGVGLYGVGRAAATKVAGRLPTVFQGGTNALSPGAIAGDVALGGYIGSGADGSDIFSPSGTAQGAAMGGLGGIGGRAAINTLGRAVSPTGGRLAPLYDEGVQPTLGQRVGGAFNRFEEAHTALPLLGGIPRSARNQAIDQAQRGAFNQALREIDDTLPKNVIKGTQAHAYMQRAFNKMYDQARSGMTFRPDGGFATEFGAVLRDVDLLPPASQNTFNQLALQVGGRLRARGGVLTGNDYKMLVSRIDSKVRAIRKNPNGDGELADALERLSMSLDDGARRHSPPEAAALLDKADRGYVKSVIIENAAKGAGAAGEFSGKQLENAIKSGAGGLRARVFLRGEAPMQEYAGAMSQLGDTVGDSGTVPRLMALGGAGAMGGVAPQALIPSAASLASNLPGIRQTVNAAIAPNRKRLAPARKQIIDRARLGSLFGISLAGGGSE